MTDKIKFVPPCELCAHAAYFNSDGTWLCNAMCLPSDPVKAKRKCKLRFEEVKPENRVTKYMPQYAKDMDGKDEPKTICDSCIHDRVCGCEGHCDEAMMYCVYREERL